MCQFQIIFYLIIRVLPHNECKALCIPKRLLTFLMLFKRINLMISGAT